MSTPTTINQSGFSLTTSYAGLKTVVSEHAMELPKGKPRTDDMRAMVEHMSDLGLVQRVPATFMMRSDDGQNVMIMHPTVSNSISKLMELQMDSMIYSAASGVPRA